MARPIANRLSLVAVKGAAPLSTPTQTGLSFCTPFIPTPVCASAAHSRGSPQATTHSTAASPTRQSAPARVCHTPHLQAMQPGSHSGTPLVSPPQNPHATTMAATSAAPVPTATAAGTPGLAVPPSLSVAAAPPAPTAPPTSGLGPPSTSSSSTHTPGAFVGPALEALEYAVKYGVPQPVAKDSSVQPVRAGSGGTKHSTKLCRYP